MMRKTLQKRLPPLLLALAMILSLLPAAAPAEAADAPTGSISATVRIDYDQSLEELQSRGLQAELWQGDRLLGGIGLTDAGTQDLSGGYTALVSLRDQSGGALYGEWPGYLDFSVGGLPQGTYTLRFTGRGYVPYEETIHMAEYAHHLIVGTGDATFTLGDVNGDGRVDEDDLDQLSAALGSELRRDLNDYDLNGDGAIDIVDLAYLNRLLDTTGGSEDLETVLLAPPVDLDALEVQLARQGVTAVSGNLEDLFLDNGRTVTFRPNDDGLIILPLEFRRTVELEELRIISPEFAAPLAGTVEVEDEDGSVFHYSFDRTVPTGVQTLSAQEDASVISIDLGQRVAVKKITITVTETADSYAAVETIQFLKEAIPADPDAAGSQVTGLSVTEGSEKVTLTWNRLPNISGYQVTWWPVSDPSRTQQRYVETNRLEVGGLENLVTYAFTVTAVDGDWSGKPSASVTATPQPGRAPDAPDMVNVTALDGALGVSWKASKSATWYEVYYTSVENAPASSYTRWGEALTGTSTTITGLTNDTSYYVYIIAGNEIGRSGPSRISSGTPRAVIYARPAGIPTEGVLDYRDYQNIRLAAPSNYSQTECPNFDPWHMADGDYRTQWTVRDWWSNEHVVVTFKEPQDLSAAIWVPRLDGTYSSNLRAYSVWVWYEGENINGPGHHITAGTDYYSGTAGGDVHTWPAIRGNPSVTKFAIMPFTPQRGVIQISVAAEQRDYTQTNLSELMFLCYDENHRLPDDIAELFADDLRTVLASSTTQAKIDQLRARLNSDERNYYLDLQALADELDLAQELLAGKTGTSVFLNGIDSRSGSRDSASFGQSGSALQPLGVAAAANSEITVYAQGIPAGETVTVYATQYNAEASAWQASMGTLENGRNVLTVPKIGSQNTARGGSLYISYSGSNAGNIRLHVRRGIAIPVLDLSDWNAMSGAARNQVINAYLAALDGYLSSNPIGSDQTDWRNVTEIATPSVLLSLPAKAVQSGLKGDRTAQLLNSVEAWEELMQVCRTVQGISGTMETRQNIRCMQMFSGAFMYAAGSHIGIGYGSCAGMVGGSPVRNLASGAKANSLFGWGIAHEIGHNMDKLGKAEITNNIYALAAQTYDGKQNTLPSRLETSGKYAAIFNKAAQGCPGASNDVFVQLGMYWQLHLAYDGGTAPLDFYTRFFTAWKAGTYFGGAESYDDKVALTASAVAGRDLTEFFTRWGMTLSAGTKARLAAYGKESRAIWYLNDQSRRDRLAGVPAAVGTVTASAVKSGDSSVVLTFSASLTNSGKVQGYEIRRNGVPIAFTTDSTYTDTIGTGNNRTYTYTVAAYDTLGSRIGEAETAEVRIAYDLTLDPDAYTVNQSGSAVTFTMTSPTAVTGLKLPAGTDISNLRISVTENGQTVSVGHTSDALRTDSVVTYFQRPGADASQSTQVWTYQATAVTVSGLPPTVRGEDVRLISYMGDDIAFLSGPTVGVMAHDYRYGPDAEDVIREGTLIITGTYRGDPTYNTVRILGDFASPDMAAANQGEAPSSAGTTRPINGTAILFASESSDKTYTNISDGIFIFIPDVQAEAELTGESTSCGAHSVLPSRIRAELWRTAEPNSAEGTRMTAQTLWINSPGGTDLPLVEVKGGGK